MAIIFELWAECKDEQSLALFVHHFEGFTFNLSAGKEITLYVEVVKKPPSLFGTRISPSGLSGFGIRTIQDAIDSTEVGLQLYYHLKFAPDFRFARIAWEAENITMSELPEWVERLNNGEKRLEIECVIDNSLYEQLGKPIFCHPFRDGYWWTRYKGEIYNPLGSSDQQALREFHRKLFPEHFKY